MSDLLETFGRVAQTIVPMYFMMILGYTSSHFQVIDEASYRGLEIFLGVYVMPAITFKMIATSNMYVNCADLWGPLASDRQCVH